MAPTKVLELVEHYRRNREAFRSSAYKETRLRIEFIDPFFEALGWDISNAAGYAEAYKDVVHEDTIHIGGSAKAPDYAFRIGGVRKFFVETKVPLIDIANNQASAFQLRRYGWNAKLPISILTNFEEFAVYDCRIQPKLGEKASKSRPLYFTYDEYPDRWEEIASVFSREAILRGSFDKYAQDATRKGTAQVDSAFLAEIENWRLALATDLAAKNGALGVRDLNDAVQRTIDRIIFLRIAEDRGFEPYGSLKALGTGKGVYDRLKRIFLNADARYNSGLFHFNRSDGDSDTLDLVTLNLLISDKVLSTIFSKLYYPESPYEFSILPADILGQVYERFLGNEIVLSGKKASVEEKPEVRKAGGVYYTPTAIVRHIVKSALAPHFEGRSTAQVSGQDGRAKDAAPVTVLDPACGSGSFLIEAYQYILDWYLIAYVSEGVDKYAKGRNPRLYEVSQGKWRLTIAEKRRILISHIYGVDVDNQAVEVTKLSLLMKVLEGERADALAAQMSLFNVRALPDLGKNIRCGNSLVSTDIYAQPSFSSELVDEIKVNPFNWKSFIAYSTKGRKFDIIIGNPPYVLLQDDNRQPAVREYIAEKYKVAEFKIDLFHVFIERGIQLLSARGILSYIVPSNFLTNNYAIALRSLLSSTGNLKSIINIKGRVFAGASVDTCVFHFDAAKRRKFITFSEGRITSLGLSVSREVDVSLANIVSDERRLLVPATTGEADVLAAMDRRGVPLSTLAYVNFGKQLRNSKLFPGDIRQISGDVAPRSYAKCYAGRNINRFQVQWDGLACLTDRVAQSGGCWDDDRQNGKPKILCRQIGAFPTVAIDELGYQCLNTMFMISPIDSESTYFLAGILNSPLISLYWSKRFKDDRETFPKIKGTYLKMLPVLEYDANNAQHLIVANTVRAIVQATSEVSRTVAGHNRNRLMQKLNALESTLTEGVAQLYGLTRQKIEKLLER
ncbi:type I restriction-modification system DNA methylase subunit [Sphingomonas sp. PP-F2F-G114-C0414]|uniref:Eco57I restriction-modification methylase domain-containing protein n=1 Tax=Sphingomonas sp. PP-F2F-G114-C0414 TaxID=2135662 RepID=UPI000F2CF0F5|nr:TaqI-like C-terminal specificity domain-containing protein [Sphingomonas sp. PP-F2F-G114-C0414]RMB36652.1 type I restriction-modification system DNA methylase subunit [Sphingomonas sp. PP-F2F-G114-C0414]